MGVEGVAKQGVEVLGQQPVRSIRTIRKVEFYRNEAIICHNSDWKGRGLGEKPENDSFKK
jgi:hypothetical protein